ncbi:YueI family protein [Sporosarcina sp. FSL K6-1522]|uniref:YueI family protein n=1 Tax=Sporosarcina sp. FSL K6-1522 TaxID=2921554 RepID=UPI00315A11E0
MSNSVDDYIQRGIYGDRETKPSERRKFLGTIRERIVIALTQAQVREHGIYPQVEEAIKENKKARLYLNGHMSSEDLAKYRKIASSYQVHYKTVTNKDHKSPIGLVLAYDYAIDKEEIYVEKENDNTEPPKSNERGLVTIFKKFFKGN